MSCCCFGATKERGKKIERSLLQFIKKSKPAGGKMDGEFRCVCCCGVKGRRAFVKCRSNGVTSCFLGAEKKALAVVGRCSSLFAVPFHVTLAVVIFFFLNPRKRFTAVCCRRRTRPRKSSGPAFPDTARSRSEVLPSGGFASTPCAETRAVRLKRGKQQRRSALTSSP